jgi:hypothetical protein
MMGSNICGDEITNEILQALNSGVIPKGWNDTTVVLIVGKTGHTELTP